MKTSVYKVLKVFGALLLLVSITLPLGKCTYYVDDQGKTVEVIDVENLPEGVHEVVSSTYALEDFDLQDGFSWLSALVFIWPVFALAILWMRPSGWVAITVRILELPLVAGSAFWIDFFSTGLSFHNRAIGAYLAFLALGLYGVGAIWNDITLFRNWKSGRHK